jgi:hypothetical protein
MSDTASRGADPSTPCENCREPITIEQLTPAFLCGGQCDNVLCPQCQLLELGCRVCCNLHTLQIEFPSIHLCSGHRGQSCPACEQHAAVPTHSLRAIAVKSEAPYFRLEQYHAGEWRTIDLMHVRISEWSNLVNEFQGLLQLRGGLGGRASTSAKLTVKKEEQAHLDALGSRPGKSVNPSLSKQASSPAGAPAKSKPGSALQISPAGKAEPVSQDESKASDDLQRQYHDEFDQFVEKLSRAQITDAKRVHLCNPRSVEYPCQRCLVAEDGDFACKAIPHKRSRFYGRVTGYIKSYRRTSNRWRVHETVDTSFDAWDKRLVAFSKLEKILQAEL